MAIWEKLFSKITFKDYPDTSTPLNATNLNKMTDAIDGIDNRVVELKSILGNIKRLKAGVTSVTFKYLNGYIIACDPFDTGIDAETTKTGIIAILYPNNTFVNEQGFRASIDSSGQARFYISNQNGSTFASGYQIDLTVQWIAYVIE